MVMHIAYLNSIHGSHLTVVHPLNPPYFPANVHILQIAIKISSVKAPITNWNFQRVKNHVASEIFHSRNGSILVLYKSA